MRFPLHSSITGLALFAAARLSSAAPTPIDYAAKIAPLFQEHCVDCHGHDDPDGELNMESFENLVKGGKAGKVFTTGDAENSLIVKFIEGRSGKEGKNKFMPPGKKEHLKPEEIALVRQWIDGGAVPPAAEGKPEAILASLPKIAPKTEPKKAVQALAFSAKGNLIATGLFGAIQLLDATTKAPLRTLAPLEGKVNALVFSADGSMLFAAAGDPGLNGIAYQFKVSDGSLVRKYEGHTDAMYALALSPDGKTLATGGYDQKIKLWNVETGAETMMLKGHNGGVFGLSFRPDGKVLASASGDRTVKLWEVASGKRLDTFSQPLKEQSVVAFSPDGSNVAAGGVDNRIRIWNVTSNAEEGSNKLLFTRYAHESAVLNLKYSSDGKSLISSAADRTVKIWDPATMAEKRALETQPDWSPALVFVDGDKHVALGRLDGSLAFYDVESGTPLAAATKPVAAASAMPKMKAAKMKAPAGAPEITRMEPDGVQSGTTTKVNITGKELPDITAVKFSNPGISAKVVPGTDRGTSVSLEITATKDLPRSQYQLSLVNAGGESLKQTLFVDYLPQIVSGKSATPVKLEQLPLNVWGTLAETGQHDNYLFDAKLGQTIILDLASRRINSKMASPRLEIYDTAGKLLVANNGLDSDSDPFIAFSPPHDGQYIARVLEITLEGSANHSYRLTAGALPYVTGWWPLSVPSNQESEIHLVGYNLTQPTVKVKAGESGDVMPPLDAEAYRSRVVMKVTVSDQPVVAEVEPNDTPANAQPIKIPSSINGRLFNEKNPDLADADLYRFDAEKGQQVVMETRASMMGSPVDTKIEVLDLKGNPVPMMIFQATKDSWLTLRSTDATAPGIRLGQFSEMLLDDYMYFNGEITKIFRLARGPDADMTYYANRGKRIDYFFTTPAAHGLDDVCYAVEPKPMGSKIVPNGLPVFTVNYANDDDSERRLGSDSYLIFTAPEKGSYLVRVSDTRGWSGDRFAYRLIVRDPHPDYSVKVFAAAPPVNVPSGSGTQFSLEAERADGWDGEIRVDVSGVPQGFFMSSPIVIQKGQLDAAGCLYALPAAKMGAQDFSKVKLTCTAMVNGQPVTKPTNRFPNVNVTAPAKKVMFMEPDVAGKPAGDGKSAPDKPYEVTIAPGTAVSMWLRVDRKGDDGIIPCDVENLPYGVIVDNIGLNGVQIRAGENIREIFLSCANFVPDQDRLCHVVVGAAKNDAIKDTGATAGFPVLLKVRKPAPVAAK